MNNKIIKKSIFCVTCIFFTMSFLGCSSQFFPFNAQPEITKAEFYPKYICAEEGWGKDPDFFQDRFAILPQGECSGAGSAG